MNHTVLSCYTTRFFLVLYKYLTTIEIYTLSLHDALPIYVAGLVEVPAALPLRRLRRRLARGLRSEAATKPDRKSTRLNSSHTVISYAVFCLKKKNGRCRPISPTRVVLRSAT